MLRFCVMYCRDQDFCAGLKLENTRVLYHHFVLLLVKIAFHVLLNHYHFIQVLLKVYLLHKTILLDWKEITLNKVVKQFMYFLSEVKLFSLLLLFEVFDFFRYDFLWFLFPVSLFFLFWHFQFFDFRLFVFIFEFDIRGSTLNSVCR